MTWTASTRPLLTKVSAWANLSSHSVSSRFNSRGWTDSGCSAVSAVSCPTVDCWFFVPIRDFSPSVGFSFIFSSFLCLIPLRYPICLL